MKSRSALTGPARDRLLALERNAALGGDRIYEGRVYSLDGRSEPLFRYERRIHTDGSALTSTHITRNASGSVVVIQTAVHSSTYEVARAETIHRQTGTAAVLSVGGSEATFTLTNNGREKVRREQVRHPIVTGPTMFGFILAHWDELRAGAAVPIRFALLERGETLGFVLDRVADADGRITIRMRATNLLVRLAVATTLFQFDAASRRVLEYTGRVPPMEERGDRLATLDAHVAYTFDVPEFK